MSREAIAAVLAREDLTGGERLVAFSLASYADRQNRARPGTLVAAGRAGLEKSRYLEARDSLVRRGFVVVEEQARGRGRASTLALAFAEVGPWWEGEINAQLFEAVLGYSRTEGPGRLLLASLAALADEHDVVEGVSTEELCAAAGVADRTYRRALRPLLASGELVLRRAGRGRGNTNSWEIRDPRSRGAAGRDSRPRRRVPPPVGVRPLVTTVSSPAGADACGRAPSPVGVEQASGELDGEKGGQDRTVGAQNCPVLSGVWRAKGCQDGTVAGQNRPVVSGVSAVNPCQDRTLSGENPAETPAENPAPNARAGREPQNPRTVHPPSPPVGGSGGEQVFVEETYVTERGRRRRRLVAFDLGAVRERLRAAGEADLAAWEKVRAFLLEAVGESTFEIWLASLELIAVELEGILIVSAPAETVGWVARRFGRILDAAAQRAGRTLRVAGEVERRAVEPLAPAAVAPGKTATPSGASPEPSFAGHIGSEPGAADAPGDTSVGSLADGPPARLGDQSTRKPTYTSAYPSSYTDVYTQTREVS